MLPLNTILPLVRGEPASLPRLLLVDDNESQLKTMKLILERNGFEVVASTSVNDSLRLIGTQSFDILLSDLHMPLPGDGLTVVSAMRNANPKAITLILSAYPEMNEAAAAILRQADEILVKPLGAELLVQTIRERMAQGARLGPTAVVDVAHILEEQTQSTIDDWLHSIQRDPGLIIVKLSDKERSAHLPQLFRDLIFRLRVPLPLGSRALVSQSAAKHGQMRRKQGYTAAMLVEESRMLQVSIFQTLQNNLPKIDFSLLLVGVMAIADEVDSQLSQQMASYITGSASEQALPLAN